jgi:glycosyltransferase involved in cell wall biosynthesis
MKLSVVIPVRNGGSDLRKCLEALTDSTRLPDELIVVDDASTDRSAQLASTFGVLVPSQSRQPIGPAKSRNRGAARAQGDILVFIDADVMVHRNTLAAIESHFIEHPEIAALFGSYDDDPPHHNWISLYKNLQHHFVHHHSKQEASSFWTGAGAIRREVFVKLGGFNEYYSQPSIEDIELGVRLKILGYQVRLCPDVRVTHLKRWNIFSLLRTDILDRAVPWTRLILATSQLPSDLNLDFKSRLSALCVWILLLLAGLGFWFPIAWFAGLSLLGLLVGTNFPLYRFFYERGGLWFAIAAIALHFLYFLYSSLTFGMIWVEHLFSRGKEKTSISYGL